MEGAGTKVPGSPRNVSIENIIESGKVFESIAQRSVTNVAPLQENNSKKSVQQPTVLSSSSASAAFTASSSSSLFPESFLKIAYSDYIGWVKRTTRRYMTQSGYEVELSIADQDCLLYGYRHGDRVRSSKGLCTVCGVASGKLWRKVDREKSIWFFGAKERNGCKLIKR